LPRLNNEETAKLLLVNLVSRFPEKKDEIRGRARELWENGYSIPEIEFLVTNEYDELEPRILAEREERERLIRDPKTRRTTPKKTQYEARLGRMLDEVDRLREQVDAAKARGMEAAAAFEAKVAADKTAEAEREARFAAEQAEREAQFAVEKAEWDTQFAAEQAEWDARASTDTTTPRDLAEIERERAEWDARFAAEQAKWDARAGTHSNLAEGKNAVGTPTPGHGGVTGSDDEDAEIEAIRERFAAQRERVAIARASEEADAAAVRNMKTAAPPSAPAFDGGALHKADSFPDASPVGPSAKPEQLSSRYEEDGRSPMVAAAKKKSPVTKTAARPPAPPPSIKSKRGWWPPRNPFS
jgi:hypothetical protein